MRNKAAFTLIELLTVIVILSVMVGLSVPNFSKSFSRMELKKTASNIAYLVRWAQARAVNENLKYQLVFLDNSRNYRILRAKSSEENFNESFVPVPVHMGRVFSIPASVTVEQGGSLKIYPDGTLDKIRIKLKGKNNTIGLSSMEQRGNLFIFEEDNES
jgi:prepilin-type N-terminal cleavage/methylation domain-containing protein